MGATIQAETVTDMVEQEQKNIPILAAEKIAAELEKFQGGSKEKLFQNLLPPHLPTSAGKMSGSQKSCIGYPRTLSDCCAEVMKGCGNAISDIDVYRGAIKHYFPNADVNFNVEIRIIGDAPTEEEINRKPEPTVIPTRQEVARPIRKPEPEVLQISLF